SELLRRQFGRKSAADAEVAKTLDRIVRNGEAMKSMIEELLESARLESGQVELRKGPVDLRAIVVEVVERVAVASPPERIRVEAPDGLPPVQGDARSLERVVSNLLDNALK